LFTIIYLFLQLLGEIVRKIQDWLISSWNRVYQVHKSVPFAEKRRRPETSTKDGFEEMEHELPFGIFCPEKNRATLLRCSRKFSAGTTQNVVFHLLSN